MRRISTCLVLLVVLALGASEAMAQSRVSTTAAHFLTLGTGAQGTALGHAYTTMATGGDALFWNPAGIARMGPGNKRGSLFFNHTDWLLDLNYNSFGLVVPVTAAGAFGFQIAQLDYGRMDVRTVALPEGTGETFGASDLVMGASYAQPLTNSFYIGGTAKYVRQSIYDMSANTFAFDIGFVLESDYLNGMRLAASIMNFGGKMQMDGVNSRVFVDIDPTSSGSNDALPAKLETRQWDLPLSFKFGVAVPVINTSNVRVELLSDAHQTNDNSLNADFGGQAKFMVGGIDLDLRAGYKDFGSKELRDNVQSHFTYGGGLSLGVAGLQLGIDYAYVPFEFLGNVQMFDLRLGF
jgi:hypothetical protein